MSSRPFKDRLCEWIEITDRWQSIPSDSSQIEQWSEIAYELADAYEFTEDEEDVVDLIIRAWTNTFRKSMDTYVPVITKKEMDALCAREQIEQRTPEWYAQMTNIISASELGNLFGPARARAQMVMAKTKIPEPRNQALACSSDRMGPFDWGIRFEPVVKQIYCYKYRAIIKELGRLIDLEDKRCTASPDGLIYSGPRAGRLIEIKCPVTREPDGIVPKEYYMQMQMQMRVTGCKACDYVEVQFISPYSKDVNRVGPGLYSGEIALIYNTENTSMRYEYGPVNEAVIPVLEKNEVLLERIPWSVYSWQEQVVLANPDWWSGVKPAIDAFWADVEKAKKGEFEVPAAKPRKTVSQPACAIIITEKTPTNEVITDNLLVSACPEAESCKKIELTPGMEMNNCQDSPSCSC
jgi:hypothetical protein